MGEVVEVGPKSTLKKGQRVVVPFTISCGDCFFCKKQQYSACDNSNPAETFDASTAADGPSDGRRRSAMRISPAAMPAARRNMSACLTPTSGRSSFPTISTTTRCCSCPTSCRPAGWRRRMREIEPGDTVAVWGCGPVGLFADPVGADHGRAPGDRHRPLPAPAGARRSRSAPRSSTIARSTSARRSTR